MKKHEAIHVFLSGIAVSASMNLATGFDRQNFGLRRFLAMALFLWSGWLFYQAALKIARAEQHEAILHERPGRYTSLFASDRPVRIGAAAMIVALVLLVWSVVR